MKTRSSIGVAAVAVLSLILPASTLAAPDVTNGSFEDGTFSDAPFDTFSAVSTAITGWTVAAGSVDAIGSYWDASDGDRSLDLNGTGPGTITQDLPTVVNATYVVTFDLSGNPDLAGPKTLDVSATGSAALGFTFDAVNARDNMQWASQTYTFVATTTNTTLTFASTTTGSFGPALDNVVVAETLPTPVAKLDCMASGWSSLTDVLAMAFKNQGDCVSYVATGGKNPAAGAPTHGVATHTASAAAHDAAEVRHATHHTNTSHGKSGDAKTHKPNPHSTANGR